MTQATKPSRQRDPRQLRQSRRLRNRSPHPKPNPPRSAPRCLPRRARSSSRERPHRGLLSRRRPSLRDGRRRPSWPGSGSGSRSRRNRLADRIARALAPPKSDGRRSHSRSCGSVPISESEIGSGDARGVPAEGVRFRKRPARMFCRSPANLVHLDDVEPTPKWLTAHQRWWVACRSPQQGTAKGRHEGSRSFVF